jgi:predicted DsbA family dithiol-disulfide isomerase
MKVEIWSDVVCPWCYIGKRRFETAMGRFDGASEVDVIWRSYQLNPGQPRGVRQSIEESLAAKTGGSIAQARAMNDRVTALAAAEGLDYHFELYKVINTFDAHRVAHLAQDHGFGEAIQERFLRAQLVEGQVLDDPETLVLLSVEVGVPAADVAEVLGSDRYSAEVTADIREAGEIGVTGVPFFAVDDRYGISGAQPAELFLEVLETARRETSTTAADATPAQP